MTDASEVPGEETSTRERWLWLLVFAVPPGIGMAGFVAVALQRGGLSLTAIGVAVTTTTAVALLVYVTMIRSAEPTESSEE